MEHYIYFSEAGYKYTDRETDIVRDDNYSIQAWCHAIKQTPLLGDNVNNLQ